MNGAEHEIFDADALRRNFDGDVDFVAHLLSKFESRYPDQLNAIVDALSHEDAPAAAEAAHRLAGETSVFYAVAARRTALHVEDLARAGQVQAATATCAALGEELSRLVRALRALPEN